MVSEELIAHPTIQAPSPGGAGVWFARAGEGLAAGLRALLSEEECEDIDRLARESDRHEAAISRGLWRIAAAEFLKVSPSRVEVERTSYGRPLPVGLERTRADLSVTHSGGLVGLVIGHGVRVGLDVERVTGASIDDRVEPAIEGVRGAAVDLIPDRTERILFAWCLVEALLKADGRGLHLAPSMVSVEARTLWGWNQARVAGNGWWVRRVDAGGGFVGAVACSAPVEPMPTQLLD